MVHARLKLTLIMVSVAILPAWSVRADDTEVYPNALLRDVYTKEQIETKKTEDLEEEAAVKKDRAEKEKARIEQEIEIHRQNTEAQKAKQDQLQEEIETVTTDLAHVSDQLAAYQDEHKKVDENNKATEDYLTSVQENLKENLQKLNDEIASLGEAKKAAEQSIYAESMDIQRMRSEIATAETKVSEADAKRADLEAQEMKVRTEWTQTKIATATQLKQRDDALNDLAEAKKRHEAALKDLNEARMELAKAEKFKQTTQKKASGEVAEYEKQTTDANHKRMNSESERIRLESETAKTLDYVARVKNNRDQAVDQADDAHGVVMKSTLALESARTELNETVGASDRKEYRKEQNESVSRGIASAQEASNLLGGGRIWVTKTKCKAYARPKEDAKPVGFFDSGNRMLGKDSGSKWVEISNGVGSTVFVSSKCGSYED